MYVEIHVTAGPAKGRSFIFKKPGNLLFGRAPDAHISVPDDQYVRTGYIMMYSFMVTACWCWLQIYRPELQHH